MSARGYIGSVDFRRPFAWTCVTCALAGVFVLREPTAYGEKFAWTPQVRHADHMPHVPEAYYSPVVRVPNVTVVASGAIVSAILPHRFDHA